MVVLDIVYVSRFASHNWAGSAVFCVLHARALNVRSCMVLCTPGLRCMCVFRLCSAWCIKGFWRKRRVVENPSAGVKSVRRNMFFGVKGLWCKGLLV